MMTARRILITNTAKEIEAHLDSCYDIVDDNIQADMMGIIDSNIGKFLNNIKLKEVEDEVCDY